VGSEMVWRNSTGEASFYSGEGVMRGMLGSSMATTFWEAKGQGKDVELFTRSGRVRRASWRRKWWTGACGRRRRPCSTMAKVVDEGDGDRARGRERSCLAASWCRGDATGERRGQTEDGGDGTRWCTGVSRDVPVHALARLGVVGTSCSGQCQALLGQWHARAGLGE
jgi:hypothetical protein